MNITQNKFRLRIGLSAVAIGIVLLWAVGVHAHEFIDLSHMPSFMGTRSAGMAFLVTGVLMVISGISLCFDLSSDVSKKKPWEEER